MESFDHLPDRPIGFSTGALAKSDFQRGLQLQRDHHTTAVELSALRMDELQPLVEALESGNVNLNGFTYVSFHAPSAFQPEEEPEVVEWLERASRFVSSIVVHPDRIWRCELWQRLGAKLLIENMDRRKRGRTVQELAPYFEKLPEAGWCFDVAHARQIDGTMLSAWALLTAFGDRLREIHISDLDGYCQHRRITRPARDAYRLLAPKIGPDVPAIIESMIDPDGMDRETRSAAESISRN